MAEVVARARSARGEIVLRRRDPPRDGASAPLELRVNGVFVMDTVHTDTEERLAREALAAVARPHRVLVGGLGLGFTLRALLGDNRVEHVTVAEMEPAVVQWVAEGLVPATAGVLDDRRVDVRVTDVRGCLAHAEPATLDAILLDVDNGPDHLVFDDNAALYGKDSLARCLACCTDDGAVVVWSASHSADLLERLSALSSSARHLPIAVSLQGRETHHHLYVAAPRRH